MDNHLRAHDFVRLIFLLSTSALSKVKHDLPGEKRKRMSTALYLFAFLYVFTILPFANVIVAHPTCYIANSNQA
jgi:hypothetical protein